MISDASNVTIFEAAQQRIADLELQLAAKQAEVDALQRSQADLRAVYQRLLEEYHLLKRRLFVAKAERVDTKQLELEFGALLAELDATANALGMGKSDGPDGALDSPSGDGEPGASTPGGDAGGTNGGTNGGATGRGGKKDPKRSTGRRDFTLLDLPETRVDLPDEILEGLVTRGLAARIGFEESVKLAYQRGGMRRLVVARVKYQTVDAAAQTRIETTPLPAEMIRRSMAAPSLLAHVLTAKYNDGLPFWRLEDIFARDGVRIDRGTMCRWADEIGGTFGATLIEAMRADAMQNAFSLSTDATGFRVQPERSPGSPRKPCDKGSYFVVLADRDHAWFEYSERETSAVVKAMFKNFSGYMQLDAKSVYDVLFQPESTLLTDEDTPLTIRIEVGCFAHMRRKYWEAALAGSPVAREALARISRIFVLDATWKNRPPDEIKRLRQANLRPHVDAFFDWAEREYEEVRNIRGSLRSALGYSVRQRGALTAFLQDGRLRLDNNLSELELRRRIAVGRKAWLFAGSHAHAQSAAGIMSALASAHLHKLDPETYLRDMIRVIPHWPRDRFLELTPKFWANTRERLVADELAAEIGLLTIPPPLPETTQEKATAD